MSDPWVFEGEPQFQRRADGPVTLVEGTSFAISSASGDLEPGGVEGVFFQDTRFISTWRVRLDGEAPQSLAVEPLHPFAATFVSRGHPRPGEADSSLLMLRTRYVGNGMREDIVVRNLGREPAQFRLNFELDADFAHLFEVKEHRVATRGVHRCAIVDATMHFTYESGSTLRSLEVAFPPDATVCERQAQLDVVVSAAGEWRTTFEFRLAVDDERIALRYDGPDPEDRSVPVQRMRSWEEQAPRIRTSDKALDATFLQSERDLGALRIFDPEDGGRSVIAAGAPWFMTLFGRDSLITSMMTLDIDPSLASGTLLTLARMQGKRVDPVSEEEPGKILHEVRRGLTAAGETRVGSLYYGSIDATPLFVMTLGELHRWGASETVVRELLPYADRALEWIEHYGDRDGDGFIEYQRSTEHGLVNQGWKDSFDGIAFADGDLATAPIALCEVQGYVYAAYTARARIARSFSDPLTADRYEQRAAELKTAFNDRFWLEGPGHFALGLDGAKRPIDALTSNIGHCLWSGIVDAEKAERTVQALVGTRLFTGWGIRTLASTMARYNPISYHNGSVWPHDTAICAAGIARYGYAQEAERVASAMFSAVEIFGGRPPELFCGFDRAVFSRPVPYPAACSPQAWASASPFLLLRSALLHLEPSVPDGTLRCTPHVPEALGELSVENLHLAGARISVRTRGGIAEISALPPSVRRVFDDGSESDETANLAVIASAGVHPSAPCE